MAGVYEVHRSLQKEEIEQLQADLQAELARGLAHGAGAGDELECHSGPTMQLSSRRAALEVEADAHFLSIPTPVHGLPTRLELAGLGDVDEIRCSVFRSRRLQRRQKHCWMEKAFVGWDWASSARKTRECLSSRCSQQRNRRRASTMLVVWRTQASKFRRRRRLALIFETRNMDHVAGRVIAAWLHLVHLRRKCTHMIGLLGSNKAHSCFAAWTQAHGERKTLHVRIRQCMHMIDRHTILRGVRGWFEMVREKRRRRLRAAKAEHMSRVNHFYSHLNAWRTFVLRQRHINHLDGDASHALTYVFQRSCAPVFAAWRKKAKQHVRQDKAHLLSTHGSPTSFINESINGADGEESPIQRQGSPIYRKDALSAWAKEDDTLSRRICVHRVGALWTLLSSALIRLNDKEVQEFCTELRPFYLCWLAYYKRSAGNKGREQALREQRERLRKSAILLAWRSKSKRNRILAQILSSMAAAGNHRLIFKAAFKEWHKIARSKYLWRHLKKVLSTIVGNRERSLLLLAFRVLEAKTLVGLHVVQVVARRVEYRHQRLLGWCFCVLADDIRRGRQLKEVGECIAAHLRLQVLTGCLILWTRCTATSSDKVETQEGHSQDFPNNCRVLLTTQRFPYGCVSMSAFIRYHCARAKSFRNMTVLQQKRDSRSALKTWSALVLVHKMHTRLAELEAAHDLLGIVALEREALELVRDLEGANSGKAGAIHRVLGLGFHGVGQYARALALHVEHKAIAEELGDRAGVATACNNLGLCYSSTGQYARALELHAEHKAIAEERGDRAGVAAACCNLGLCYSSTGQYAQALELHAEHKAIAEELGDRAGVAAACCNLGLCYGHTGQYARALELHAEHKAIAEELGDRAGVARQCANLGLCYYSMGQYARALELHAEHKAIAEELGDRAGVAAACGKLGVCCYSMGQYARALELHAEHKAIAEELGDRAGVAAACSSLGNCYERMGQYARALELHVEHKAIAEKLGDRAGVMIACGKRMAARVRLHYLLRIFLLWRHAASCEQLKGTAVSRRLIHVQHQICADACWSLLDSWKRRVLRHRCLHAKVRKCARKLVERVIESWSWCQRSRSWRRWAVPICVQRHNNLLLQNIMVAWEEEKGDRGVIRHIRWKRHRICKSFAFVWWRQYTQERRFQHWAVRERRVNVSEMVSKFHHLDAHCGVSRLGTFPFFYMRARHVHAFLDAHFVLWVSVSVMIRRIRLRNESNEKILCRHKRRSVLTVAWEALLDNAGKVNAGKVNAGKDRQGQCNTSNYANIWNHVFKFISARVRKQKLYCLVLWSNLPTYNRRIARHIAKRQAKIVSCVFEALIVLRVAAGRVVNTLKKAQYAAVKYMDEILVAILSGWKSLSRRKNTLRHVRRKTMWHLQDMKRRACFLVWIVFAKRQRRFASATEAIEQRRAGEVVRDAVGKWSAAVVHWQRLCWAHRTVARRFESLLLRKCIRGWVDVTAGLSIAELLFQHSFDHLQLRVAKELMFLCFEVHACHVFVFAVCLHIYNVCANSRSCGDENDRCGLDAQEP
jgi:tetratricopeptide (TPR) repeat protein